MSPLEGKMRQIKSFGILCVLLLVVSCFEQAEKVQNEKKIEVFPLVLDTFGVKAYYSSFHLEEPVWLTTGYYGVHYIGPWKDSIYIHPSLNYSMDSSFSPSLELNGGSNMNKNPFDKYFLEYDFLGFKNCMEAKLEVRIDTSQRLASFYPVLITNLDPDTVVLGSGEDIPMVMEALDSNYEWKPIQRRYVHMCGVGLSTIILPPQEVAMSLALLYRGAYKTKLRLRFGNNYSEPFNGSINYQQFKNELD